MKAVQPLKTSSNKLVLEEVNLRDRSSATDEIILPLAHIRAITDIVQAYFECDSDPEQIRRSTMYNLMNIVDGKLAHIEKIVEHYSV